MSKYNKENELKKREYYKRIPLLDAIHNFSTDDELAFSISEILKVSWFSKYVKQLMGNLHIKIKVV